MADRLRPDVRSRLMSRIRSKNTAPELLVRRLLFGLGYRFRLHSTTLPGHPDIVFPGRRRVVFVHGCFWHRHAGCKFAYTPASRESYWLPKLRRNVERDHENQAALERLGWSHLIVWECELSDLTALTRRLTDFLGPSKAIRARAQISRTANQT